MISDYTFNAITPLITRLKEKNIHIQVDEKSPVGILNRAGFTPLLNDRGVSDEVFFTELPTSLKRDVITGDADVVRYTLDGTSYNDVPVTAHETTLGETKRILSDSVLDLLSFCRNVVHPAIDGIFKRYDDPEYQRSSEFWSIVPIPQPTYLLSGFFETILSKIPNGEINLRPTSKGPSIPTDLKIPESGHSEFDEVLTELVNTIGNTPCELLSQVWNDGEYVPSGSSDAWKVLPRQAARLLLLMYYKDNPWEDSGMNLAIWENTMESAILRTGQWINQYLECTVERISQGLLLSGFDEATRSAFIYEEVYADYLERGGRIEAFHGALYRINEGHEAILTTESIIENEQLLIQTWEAYHAVNTANNDAEWLANTRHMMSTAICSWIESVEDTSIFPTDDFQTRHRPIINGYVHKHLDREALSDVTMFLIRCLFLNVFTHVDGRDLMTNIHIMVKDGMDIRTATYSATRSYVEDYVFSGLSI